jgi:hypothetical protein
VRIRGFQASENVEEVSSFWPEGGPVYNAREVFHVQFPMFGKNVRVYAIGFRYLEFPNIGQRVSLIPLFENVNYEVAKHEY